mgnify:FL=1
MYISIAFPRQADCYKHVSRETYSCKSQDGIGEIFVHAIINHFN